MAVTPAKEAFGRNATTLLRLAFILPAGLFKAESNPRRMLRGNPFKLRRNRDSPVLRV